MVVDSNLSFLQHCCNDDLKALSDILTFDGNGEPRMTEQLLNTSTYITHYPYAMQGMWRELACEYQKFGGNTIANLSRRGNGAHYDEILSDVCHKVGVDTKKCMTIEEMELSLLQKVFSEAIYTMNTSELRELAKEYDLQDKDIDKQMLLTVVLMSIRRGRGCIASGIWYVCNYISRMLLGQGVLFIGKASLGRFISVLSGPIGWGATTAWAIWDIASPAYRVTIPATILIASMHVKLYTIRQIA